ncbi:class I glutamine amidotransferase-like protein, partial [Alternaria rosae]|uniref:class I glutamine amidotransferase-like protein n=1 Tax=Alternaria rosae TaxID=1187941 RepID=UPI001E8DB499
MARVLRICMLNADAPVPAVAAERAPTYGRIFHQLLSSAAIKTKLSGASLDSAIHITSTDFDVTKNEYPASIADFDAVIISGSANSAYDELPWIRKLARWTKELYEREPSVKIFGSCFGHQLVCQALLGDHGVKVEKHPEGWELGVKEITLHRQFYNEFFGDKRGRGDGYGEKMRLQFVHHDHVVVPHVEALPGSWTTMGSTRHCTNQGMYEPGRVLTFQGHFEFDRFINSETIKYFFPNWQPKVLEETLDAIDADDDSVAAAGVVLKFL